MIVIMPQNFISPLFPSVASLEACFNFLFPFCSLAVEREIRHGIEDTVTVTLLLLAMPARLAGDTGRAEPRRSTSI